MNWIEWKNSIINLRHVKSIYFTQESSYNDMPDWTLNILMNDKEGKYVRHFESKEECEKEYERIKNMLDVVLNE